MRAELLSRRHIQGYDVNVLEAIYHVVEHFSMHTGQIILLSKARVGQDLKLWERGNPSVAARARRHVLPTSTSPPSFSSTECS